MFDKTTGYDSGLIFARGKLILIINFEGNMKKILGFLALGVFAGTVNATIIDFESGSISSGGIYTEDGFNLTVNNYFGAMQLFKHLLILGMLQIFLLFVLLMEVAVMTAHH
jgi:hypothetical protein